MKTQDPTPIPRERPARRRRRDANPEARRRLLDAASLLIQEQGMATLRVEDVAKEAGLSVGTFYIYFKGKDDLFTKLVVEYTGRLRAAMQAAYSGEGTLEERFARGMVAYLDFVEENEKGFLHFIDAGSIRTDAGRLSAWAMDQHALDLIPLLEEGIAEGTIRPMSPLILAHTILGTVQHAVGWWLEHRESASREEFMQFLMELTGRGFMSR